MPDLNPSWNPRPDDGASRVGLLLGRYAAQLLADPNEPGITQVSQLVDGCAEVLLTFIASAPAELREKVFSMVVTGMVKSRGGAFEAVDEARRQYAEATRQ